MLNFPLAPPQASSFADAHDWTFALITVLTLLFTVGVMALCAIFAIRYRAGSKASRKGVVHDSKTVEFAWTIPPLILGIIVFGMGAKFFVDARIPPKDATELFVIGKRWMWHIEHPSGVRENNTLHVPLGKDIKLTMISQDVIHAFYVPAFRTQYMVVPGKYSTLWFKPTKVGKYPLFCNMYCGTQHSEMGGYVYVMEPAEYASWLKRGGEEQKQGVITLADHGKEIFNKLNCGNCHTGEDTFRAPTLNGIAGAKRPLINNGSAIADDEYLRESLKNKDRKITAGYQDTMPSYSTLSEEEIRYLVEYIKSLGGSTTAVTTPATTTAPAAPLTTAPVAGGVRQVTREATTP